MMEGPSKKLAVEEAVSESLEHEHVSYNGEQNPFMNDLILECLFENIGSAEDLSSCRLVCNKWYNQSAHKWLNIGLPITIEDSSMFRVFIKEFHCNSTNGNSQGEITKIKQYPKFQFDYVEENTYHSQLFEIFWNQCGAWLSNLTLVSFPFPDIVTLNKIMLCSYTPNLKFLDVEIKFVKGPIELEILMQQIPEENQNLETLRVEVNRNFLSNWMFPICWKIIFCCYPNLKNLAVGNNLSSSETFMKEILTAIADIRNGDNSKMDLKSLKWFFNKNHKEYTKLQTRAPLPWLFPELLRRAKLNLETFRFDFVNEDPENVVNNVLSSYASTLKELQFYKWSALHLDPFAGMVHLKSLTLSGFPVKNLFFLKELPTLCSLNLFGNLRMPCAYDDNIIKLTTESNQMHEMTFPSLKQFCCNYEADWEENDLIALAGWMTNLAHLELFLDNNNFRFVCAGWPNLEHLSVFGIKIGDKGLVGMKWIQNQLVYQEPNITNLRNLKEFAIENLSVFTKFTGRHGPTEHSVVFGFLKLAQLTKLEIQPKLDHELVKFIRERIPFAKVTPVRPS